MKQSRNAKKTRRGGHAETPFLLVFFSVVAGAVGATLFVLRHREYSLRHKIEVFIISPLFGLLGVVAFLACFFLLSFLGDRWGDFFARWKKK